MEINKVLPYGCNIILWADKNATSKWMELNNSELSDIPLYVYSQSVTLNIRG